VTAPTRTQPRLLVALAVAFVLVVAVTGAFSLMAQGFRSTSDFTRTLTPKAGLLTVHNETGDVMLMPSRDGLVHVFADSQYGISEPRLSAESTDQGVVLDGSCDSDLAVECTVDFTVQVPASFEVQVQSGAGQVAATDLSGALTVRSTAGDVRLDDVSGAVSVVSGAGQVEANGLRGDTVDVVAGAGDVRVGMSTVPTSMRVRSDRGDVDIAVPATEEYRIDATAAGSTELAVAEDPTSAHSITASSGIGDVRIWPALRGPRIFPAPPVPPRAPGAVPAFPGDEDGPQPPDVVRVFPGDGDRPQRLPG
jgi:hypothetical protein